MDIKPDNKKAMIEQLPPRITIGRMTKYGDIYRKLLACKHGEGVKIQGVDNRKAKSIFMSIQTRTMRVHGKRVSLRKSKEPDTFFIMWRI